MNIFHRSGCFWAGVALSAALAFAPSLASAAPLPPDVQQQAKRSPLLAAMQAELERSFQALNQQDPKAYYIGYTVTDTQRAEVSGSNGALLNSNENHSR